MSYFRDDLEIVADWTATALIAVGLFGVALANAAVLATLIEPRPSVVVNRSALIAAVSSYDGLLLLLAVRFWRNRRLRAKLLLAFLMSPATVLGGWSAWQGMQPRH